MGADDTRGIGGRVERAAQAYLQTHGLQPIDANANTRGGEVDLVMRDGEAIVFIEVRYRRHAGFGGGAASVDAGKRRRLVHAARVWLQRHPQHADAPCRFDVVEADGDIDAPHLHWLHDAFRADD